MKQYISIIIVWLPLYAGQQAMVIKPVIDLFFSPEMPHYSPASFDKDYETCQRAHQLLMHDVVTVLERHAGAYKLEVPQACYIAGGKPTSLYWTATDNLALLTQEQAPYTVTLIRPYYEPHLNVLYSHGTQFAQAPQDTGDPETLAVYAYNPENNGWVVTALPREYCLLEQPCTAAEQRKLFIKLILDSIELAAKNKGVIPYVWGGKSFTFAQPDEYFMHAQGFDRSILTNPVTGFDCSNMIMHYAQLAGITWPHKSSATLALYGTEKKSGESIEEGDILWIPGHVMVIMKNKREIIEAAGYKWLYGRVHKIKIKDRFSGAHTVDDILSLYRKNGHIKLYDKHKKSTLIPEVKVFSLIA